MSEIRFPSDTEPVRIFYSYSRRDERLRKELEDRLALLKRQGQVQDWHDRQIVPGQDWAHAIEQNLGAADIVLLLVSPAFIASDYIWDKEMARALERHEAGEARVIPIIVRPVDWHGLPFSKLQALPTDGKPVTEWRSRDIAWLDVTTGIRTAIDELRRLRNVAGRSAGWSQQEFVEFVFVLEFLVEQLSESRSVGQWVTNEKRRLMLHTMQLRDRLRALLPQLATVLDPQLAGAVSGFVEGTLGNAISLWGSRVALDAAIPLDRDGDLEAFRNVDRELRDQLRGVGTEWPYLRGLLLEGEGLEAALERLKSNDRQSWPLLGFEDRAAYEEYVSPRSETLIHTAGPMELALFEVLLERTEVTKAELFGLGFPREVTNDVLNALIDDKYLLRKERPAEESIDDPYWNLVRFHLSPIGAKILAGLMEQGRPSKRPDKRR